MNSPSSIESPNRISVRNVLLRAYHKVRLLLWSFFHLPPRVRIGKVWVGTRSWRVANFCRSAEVEHGELRYERPETELFLEIIKGKRCFFDIGAHIGYYSFLAASEGVPRVIAFEVMRGLCDAMRRTARENGLGERLEVVEGAVGASERRIHFAEPFEEVRTRAFSLDRFCSERNLTPDLIKIDVEGFEHEALIGAEHVLRERHPDLIISLHEKFLRNRESSSVMVLELLKKYGYRHFHPIVPDTLFVSVSPPMLVREHELG